MPYAYQAGDNCYGRGDYYRGDYYRGDFLGIGKAIKKIGGVALKVVGAIAPGPVGMIARGLTQAPGTRVPFFPPEPSIANPFAMGMGGGGGVQGPVGTMTSQGFLPGCQLKGTRPNRSGYYKQVVKGNPTQVVYIPKGSVCVKSRRLNVANPRALRKAIRRAQGFSKLARRVMTFVSAKAPKGRGKFKKAR